MKNSVKLGEIFVYGDFTIGICKKVLIWEIMQKTFQGM